MRNLVCEQAFFKAKNGNEKMTEFVATLQKQIKHQKPPAKTPGQSARTIRRKYELIEQLKESAK